MDKNAIKRYATWARRELIARVSQKAEQYGVTEKEPGDARAESVGGRLLSREERAQRGALILRVRQSGYRQVMEEAAYTWFNRFCALRFMEVNRYLPAHIRVFTDEGGAFKPQILAEAIHLEMDGLDMDRVYHFKSENRTEELYKYLLVAQCNALNAILPHMFQRIADDTELLLPDNLLREGSVIERMIALIPESDWTDQVQIIGWLYQYYNAEPKDQVFANLKKNIRIGKADIPAATQLFTPDWIVRYMVENSLGRLWVEGHPSDALKANWRYYLEEAGQEPDVRARLSEIRKEYAGLNPEDIRCVDPCMGSGHILAYMFDVLMQIYGDYGYPAHEAVRSIVENNLYGLDIDDRAAQLAYFAVMMKARQYDRRFFSRSVQPHVCAIQESERMPEECWGFFGEQEGVARRIHAAFADAKEYGSLLEPGVTLEELDALERRMPRRPEETDLAAAANAITASNAMRPLVRQARMLVQKYDAVVTNPPYMGSGMGEKLDRFVKGSYPDSKSDLFAVFMERCAAMTRPNGCQAMITQHAWMFLSSFEKLRAKLLRRDIINMAHLGARAFEEIGGEVVQTTSFVMRNSRIPGYRGTYARLIAPATQQGKEDMFLARENRYTERQDNFLKIPGAPVAYWLSHKFIQLLSQENTIGSAYESGSGLSTADNDRFLRFFWEVDRGKIAENAHGNKKWYLFYKGGEYRKWYGNLFYVVNWENDGEEIKHWVTHNPKDPQTTSWSRRIFNTHLYFLTGVTWSVVSGGDISFRAIDENAMISNAAGGIFGFRTVRERDAFMAALNTKIWTNIFSTINPTLNYSSGVIQKAPAPMMIESSLGSECRELSKADWDAFETSWDFQRHPLICGERTVAAAFAKWEREAKKRFDTLKSNEEELNRIFIDLYGLQDELTPEVDDRDVTVRRADLKRDIRSLVSYAVGCMFGRYSLSAPGLAYAGGAWDERKYGGDFPPDRDNILPICDDEYFPDDIAGRFTRFVEAAFGTETLEENLRFIAGALGGGGSPRDVIRGYFLNDFYADHLKIYQKRPVYWLFDSGRKNAFKALIYMHRYAPDTVARVRTDYVHEQQSRYRTAIADLENRMASASAGERVKLSKQLSKVRDQAEELRAYEERIHHLADRMIPIDLDDGVKRNYERFQDVLAKIQ